MAKKLVIDNSLLIFLLIFSILLLILEKKPEVDKVFIVVISYALLIAMIVGASDIGKTMNSPQQEQGHWSRVKRQKSDSKRNSEIWKLDIEGADPSKILSWERYVEYVEWKLNRGMIPGLDSKDCEVGTGGWGLGKCENQGIYQCPRCSKYCCENHKSWVRTYIGEPVCEPCSRDMQDY